MNIKEFSKLADASAEDKAKYVGLAGAKLQEAQALIRRAEKDLKEANLTDVATADAYNLISNVLLKLSKA